VGGLLAGVVAGVVLPTAPNRDGFGVPCVACVPKVPDAVPPLNRLVPEAGWGCWAGVLLFASEEASLVPLPKPAKPGKALEVPPNGFAGVEPGAADPNRPGVEDAEVVAGLGAKREDVG
jgi:hypothetical protein